MRLHTQRSTALTSLTPLARATAAALCGLTMAAAGAAPVTTSNVNDAVRIWGLDTSGTPQQITGMSVEPYQGDPFTVIYADDNQGTPITTRNPNASVAYITLNDGGLADTLSSQTYVTVGAGSSQINVAGDKTTFSGTMDFSGATVTGINTVPTLLSSSGTANAGTDNFIDTQVTLGTGNGYGLPTGGGTHTSTVVSSIDDVVINTNANGGNGSFQVNMGDPRVGQTGNLTVIQSTSTAGGPVTTVGNGLSSSATFSSSGVALAGNTSVAGALSASGDLAIGSGTFVVSANSGNTAIAGTLDVAGATTIEGALNANGGATVNNGFSAYAGNATGNNLVLSSSGTTITGATAIVGTSTLTGTANINTTGTAATTIGNANVATTVNASGGNSRLALANNAASVGVVGGGGFVANTASATMAGTGTLATNGTSGTTAGTGAGGVTVYNGAQTVADGSTVNDALSGVSFQNQINGNTFVDGNMYINGTLAYVSSNSATTTVVGSGTGTSNLGNATQGTSGGTSIVMKGSDGADESRAALTLTNGIGNTHGVEIYENRTVLSGGTQSTTMTLDDNGATFSNSTTGGPARVHGVANGRDDFDAVNVQQLREVARGVASVTAIANIPGIDEGKNASVGVGVGNYQGQTAIAMAANVRFSRAGVFRASVGTVNGSRSTVGAGASFSW